MAAWWSPVRDGFARLLGREASAPRITEASTPAARAPAEAWRWRPPVQRTLDPEWQPQLAPARFVDGLASHRDPSLRRDLVHDVEPAAGGLAAGLADLAPGQPRVRTAGQELPVRGVRTTRAEPTLQRSVRWSSPEETVPRTPELDLGAPTETVALEPPWEADANEPVPPAPVPSTPEASTPEPAPSDVPTAGTRPGPSGSTRPAAPSAPSVQRLGGGAPAPVQRVAEPGGAEPGSDGAELVEEAAPGVAQSEPSMPVVPTVPRTTAAVQTSASQVGLPRPLPVVALPPRPPVTPLELPLASRSLPVLQRAPNPTGPAASEGADEPSTVARASEPAPGDEPETRSAPLSGFAEAIERLSQPPAPRDEPTAPAPAEPPVVGPVVPSGPPQQAGPSVQRVEADPTSSGDAVAAGDRGTPDEPGTAPSASLGVPLLGRDLGEPPVTTHAPVHPVQRSADDDLPALPVVSRSALAPGEPPSAPPLQVVPGPGSDAGPDAAVAVQVVRPSGQHPAGRPVVARSAAGPSESRATAPYGSPPGTAPLTGARPLPVQHRALAPSTAGVVPTPPVQRLRHEPDRTAGAASSGSSGNVGPATPGPAFDHETLRSLTTPVQRTAAALPAVAPGLVEVAGPVDDVRPGWSGPTTAASLHDEPARTARPAATDVVRLEPPTAPTPADRPLQRLTTMTPSGPAPRSVASAASSARVAVPAQARALPFEAMFAAETGDGVAGTAGDEAGWTTVELPVTSDAEPPVQRAVDTAAVTAEPEPVAATPPAEGTTASPSAAAPAHGAAAGPGGVDLDEMARRLFDPLSARLRAELWLDRERAGLVADARL